MSNQAGYVDAIEEACNRLGTGQWSLERFGVFVVDLKESILEQHRQFQEISLPEELQPYVRDSAIHARIGKDLWLSGAEKLIEFAETTDVEVLEVALDLCQQGHDTVERAVRTVEFKLAELEHRLSQTE